MGGGGGGWTGLVVSWKTIVFYCVCSQPRALLTYFNPVRKNIKFVLDLTRHSSESSPLPPRNRQQTPCCCLAGTTFSFTALTSAGIKLFLTAEKSHISLITLNFPNTQWNHCILFCVIKWKILTCHASEGQKYLKSGVFSFPIVPGGRRGEGGGTWPDKDKFHFLFAHFTIFHTFCFICKKKYIKLN